MPKFNHAVSLAFTVISEDKHGEDFTPEMLKHALLRRVADLDASTNQAEWLAAIGAPDDTYEEDDSHPSMTLQAHEAQSDDRIEALRLLTDWSDPNAPILGLKHQSVSARAAAVALGRQMIAEAEAASYSKQQKRAHGVKYLLDHGVYTLAAVTAERVRAELLKLPEMAAYNGVLFTPAELEAAIPDEQVISACSAVLGFQLLAAEQDFAVKAAKHLSAMVYGTLVKA
jgi:hypothetical protein